MKKLILTVAAIALLMPLNLGYAKTYVGSNVYKNKCQSCHGLLASSTKKGADVQKISGAIQTVPEMKGLSKLNAAQVQAVAGALSNTAPPPPVDDGAALYGKKCQGCHGQLVSSAKRGATAEQIQNAVATKNKMKKLPKLQKLTAAQIQAIAAVLAGGAPPPPPPPPPTSGAALYNDNCSSCHGAIATSEVRGKTPVAIQNAIDTNKGGKMGSLKTISSNDIKLISKALSSSAEYNSPACNSCHFSDGSLKK